MNLNMKSHSKKEERCQNLELYLMNSLPRGSLRKHINVKSYSEENSKNIKKMTLFYDNVNYKKRFQKKTLFVTKNFKWAFGNLWLPYKILDMKKKN